VDHAANHRINYVTNLEAVKYPIESRGRRQHKLFYRSHPKEGSGFVSSVTSQNLRYAQWQSNAGARYRHGMKVISPTVIALVLWLLFFASHAFAVLKSPYPIKAQPPDSIISADSFDRIAGATGKPTENENWHQISGNAAFAFQRKPCAQILGEQLTTASVQLTLFTAKVGRRLTSAAITAGCVDLQANAFKSLLMLSGR
jgi:hypothetical protein